MNDAIEFAGEILGAFFSIFLAMVFIVCVIAACAIAAACLSLYLVVTGIAFVISLLTRSESNSIRIADP